MMDKVSIIAQDRFQKKFPKKAESEVYSRIGPSFSSQKEQTVERLGTLVQGMAPEDPIRKILQLKFLW